MITLSVSSAATWRQCRQRYQYRHVDGLRAKGPRPVPLERGTIIHEFLAAHHVRGNWLPEYMQRQEWFAKLFAEEREAYGETLIEDCGRVVTGWVARWQNDLSTIFAEEKFEIDVEDFRLKGVIDWLARDASGSLWLVEHKTWKTHKPGEAERLGDLQTAVYLLAVERLTGERPVGVMHDYLRSVPPEVPRTLKNGQLSRAKDLITDRATYMKAIEANGLSQLDYVNELSRAEATSFYERRYLARPKEMVQRTLDELEKQAADMATGPVYRNLTKDCGGCEYNALCEATMFGLDVEFVRRSEYRTREVR